ncbi:MAG: hypothetical protein GKC10_07550 [Methanosarcinales archaeon]|nr:hypothetical protein [Methanosarcinales archaeon]
MGRYVISVLIRDGNDEEGALDFDDSIECPYTLEESRPEIHAQPPPSNSPPTILDFWPDEGSPQVAGTVVRWNVQTEDPDSDQVDIKFKLKDASTGEVLLATGWGPQSTWSWDTSGWEPADYMIEVQARDGNHASADDYDDISDQEYSIL